jgi:hypothetical protein
VFASEVLKHLVGTTSPTLFVIVKREIGEKPMLPPQR